MGLETNKLSSLWKDRAVVEINVAVLYSFQVSQWVCYLERHWIACISFSFHLQQLYANIFPGYTQCTGGYQCNSNCVILHLHLEKRGKPYFLLLPKKNLRWRQKGEKKKRKLRARLFTLLAQMSKCQNLCKATGLIYFICIYGLFKISW